MSAWLVQGYLAINALLYGAVAVRTVLGPDAASSAAGFTIGSPGGRSEFLVTNAGLTLALAAIFTVLAVEPGALRLGLKVAIVLYLSLLLFRIVPPLVAGDRFGLAAGPTAIEALLLIAAVALLQLLPAGAGAAG